jgi:hypothetical protein
MPSTNTTAGSRECCQVTYELRFQAGYNQCRSGHYVSVITWWYPATWRFAKLPTKREILERLRDYGIVAMKQVEFIRVEKITREQPFELGFDASKLAQKVQKAKTSTSS